jgi:membrane-associated protease RseP (regulator of RpoE activity)
MAALLLSVAGAAGVAPGDAAAARPEPLIAQAPAAKPTLRGKQGTYTASVFVAVPAPRAWGVLVNYEAMAGVMPDIKDAKVLRRNGPVVEVQQTYQAPYTFGRRIKAVLTMRESAPRQLSYTLVRGDQIRELRGTWTITPVAGGVQLRHQIQVDPEMPSFVRPLYFELMETNLRQSMAILKRLMEQG